jgi:hypothetical protein
MPRKTKKQLAESLVQEKEQMIIKGYTLTSRTKLLIAAEGDGKFKGVGWDNEDALLAEYDKRGGAIFETRDVEDEETGEMRPQLVKLRNGTFYDYENGVARSAKDVVSLRARKPKARGISVVTAGDAEKGGGTTSRSLPTAATPTPTAKPTVSKPQAKAKK